MDEFIGIYIYASKIKQKYKQFKHISNQHQDRSCNENYLSQKSSSKSDGLTESIHQTFKELTQLLFKLFCK